MKLSLILLAGLAGAACLRGRSAALRHWIVAVAIVCAGATPLLERVVPEWSVRVPAPAAHSVATPTTIEVRLDTPRGAAGPAPTARPAAAPIAWAWWIWMIGAVSSLVVLATGIARLAWLTSRSTPATGRWRALAAEICSEYNVRRRVDVLQSHHPSILATFGVVRPKIIVPASAGDWPDDLVKVILQHELAHIRRFDWAMQIAGELLRTLYWFNPLMWLACARLRVESEQACDDEVLRSGAEASAYAAHLLTLARQFSQPRTWFPAPAMARPSTLHRRVAAMLNSRTNRAPVALPARVGTLIVLLVTTAVIAAAQATATFTGTLVDPQGAVLPDVRVTLTSGDRTYQADTNARGQFQFPDLTPGEYALSAQLPGFKKYQQSVSIANANVVRTIPLELGQVHETIHVVDAADSTPTITTAAGPRETPACTPTTSPAPPNSVRVGGNIRPPIKIKHVSPIYPASLRGTNASGDVVLDGVIGIDGVVHDLRAHPGTDQAFVDAMMTAVSQWQFESTLLNCVPVEVPITISGQFRPQVP